MLRRALWSCFQQVPGRFCTLNVFKLMQEVENKYA